MPFSGMFMIYFRSTVAGPQVWSIVKHLSSENLQEFKHAPLFLTPSRGQSLERVHSDSCTCTFSLPCLY